MFAVFMLTSFCVISCGEIDKESETVPVNSFASTITKGSEEGTQVPDPLDPEGFKNLIGDFFYFSVQLQNNNTKSVVITNVVAEVTDLNNNGAVSTFSYAPQTFTHCLLVVPDQISSGRFFSFMAPGKTVTIGNFDRSLFYIDNVKEGEAFGGYQLKVLVTVTGFFTSATPADFVADSDTNCTQDGTGAPSPVSPDDPFLKNEGPYKRITYFEKFN